MLSLDERMVAGRQTELMAELGDRLKLARQDPLHEPEKPTSEGRAQGQELMQTRESGGTPGS